MARARSYVIDGYNALHKLYDPAPASPDTGRRSLVQRVHDVLKPGQSGKRGGDRVHLVFDARKGGARGGTHGRDGPVSWSYADGSADDAIVEIVRANEGSHDGLDIVVVTDDRELRGRVKQLGAAAMRVHEWFDDHPSNEREPEEPRPGTTPGLRSKDFTAEDFGLTDRPIDLDRTEPDDL